ncbi:Na(+)/glucose symporter [Limihaloglobus sulfuriphilus]|uniref:Na(+)/glucose symporter n=1 Tax=Limihaloglobus sulfuriphilus TaxID=1851148 RepID=A0A1Q2MCT9_9BACT|nr:sodium/solute symporter [Limihaloglobus sulfuriphilus]AQQ70490.1 Na(+)/glucose symporter [Limihaloglobus sulfuriphilus]
MCYKKVVILFLIFICVISSSVAAASDSSEAREYLSWESLSDLPESLGVAGSFAGVYDDALIVAGGANFQKPYWESDKQWYDKIWILEKTESDYKWYSGSELDRPIAYGMSISTDNGLVCIGGAYWQQCYSDVFILRWDRNNKKIIKETLPSLPEPCAYGSAAVIDDIIYVAGGQSSLNLESAMNNFWSLDLSQKDSEDFTWQELSSWPGPSRAFNITVSQHNGQSDCIYLISGRRIEKGADVSETEFLKDVYEYNPLEKSWQKKMDVPSCVMAGSGIDVGQSHIFILSGADGSLFFKGAELKLNHPGFPKQIWTYHTITDTWISAGKAPANQVTSTAVKWDDSIVLVSGEIMPRVRSPKIWQIKPVKIKSSFGFLNFTTLVIYLLAMVAVGFYFSFRNKDTNDFFRGGQRLPGWAAGLSIFATMLSSITFVAIPAKVYSTDWTFFVVNMMAIVVTPFVIYFVLPFFRRIDATSAYEYLEKRFNILARLFASFSFVLFQIGRMAIVMFLPALALTAITGLPVSYCILAMGVLSIIYCTMGGLEAVIWTDSIQTFILLGGAFLSLVIVLLNIEGGPAEFFTIANENSKFHAINFDFSSTSFMTTALWVMIIGGIGQSLIPYVSDQAVVQRYLAVSDIKTARISILTNAIIIIPATLLFFSVGTALFVFYKANPQKLDPTFQNDAIFPLFISRELPIGISGLVVAGIFAAAQSTVSTSMNSISTVIVTDFVKPFGLLKTERGYLNLARFCTFFFGVLGTLLALLFAASDIKSLWESFMGILGLFGGSMCGLFLLGIFVPRVGSVAAISGAITGAVILFLVQSFTQVSFLLYAAVGILSCFICGYLLSFILPKNKKDLSGLTINTVWSPHD